jgi:hypothetical protein
MADRSAPGDALSRRLMSRAEGGVYRRAAPDGGEVVTGPLVRQALRTLGARAMTMDHTIFVDEDFDLANPEDQALYAHERHHQLESGGTDDHGRHDAEEMAARTIERMVLHRSASGEDFSSILRDVEEHGEDIQPSSGGRDASGKTAHQDGGEDEALAAFQALLATGKTHEDVARELARYVLGSMTEADLRDLIRSATAPMF